MPASWRRARRRPGALPHSTRPSRHRTPLPVRLAADRPRRRRLSSTRRARPSVSRTPTRRGPRAAPCAGRAPPARVVSDALWTRRRRRPAHQHHQSPRGTPPRSPRRTARRRRSSSSARSCRQSTDPRARGRGPVRWTTITASAWRRRASPGLPHPSRAPLACQARCTQQLACPARDRTPTAPGRTRTTCCPPPRPLARRPPYLTPRERVSGRPPGPRRRSVLIKK
mmetsp:Transcript_2677/g.7763  ORF Transcript_2677/g.7763 Transcript_2677/m.7763 type:complete len:226 (-) Transcript_2677:1893-2570(-)